VRCERGGGRHGGVWSSDPLPPCRGPFDLGGQAGLAAASEASLPLLSSPSSLLRPGCRESLLARCVQRSPTYLPTPRPPARRPQQKYPPTPAIRRPLLSTPTDRWSPRLLGAQQPAAGRVRAVKQNLRSGSHHLPVGGVESRRSAEPPPPPPRTCLPAAGRWGSAGSGGGECSPSPPTQSL
jgi:hypothetical protein